VKSNNHLPDKINSANILIKRLNFNKELFLFNELMKLYKKNNKHLHLWHLNKIELNFNNIEAYIKYLKSSKLLCYVLINNKKVIGCIEVGKLSKCYESLKYRYLTFWLDEDNKRKYIMFKALSSLLDIFKTLNIDYIKVMVDDKNIASINLLKKLGFYILTKYSAMDIESLIPEETTIEFRNDISVLSEEKMREFKIRKGLIKK